MAKKKKKVNVSARIKKAAPGNRGSSGGGYSTSENGRKHRRDAITGNKNRADKGKRFI